MAAHLDVNVTGMRRYPVFVDQALSGAIGAHMGKDGINTARAIAVIDANVDTTHRQYYENLLGTIFGQVHWFVMPSGEQEKNAGNWKAIVDFALAHEVRRNTPLLAIGGGVTGDLAGFAASSIMRGLPLYHFPTTLLAMVDSSIGGKTGMNHASGKNLIGAFYQPQAVFAETRLLESLPRREWLCGLGEILKYAAIDQPSLFDEMANLMLTPQWHDHPDLVDIIYRCAAIKARIVQEDEKESGIRAYLNLGHTFAHALEAFTEYKTFSHGEAVYIGLVAAAHLSMQKGGQVDAAEFLEFRELYDLSTRKYIHLLDEIVPYMYKDKKILDNKIRLVLLTHWGKPYTIDTCSMGEIEASWKYALETINTR
ncbi:MAG: 3-dehydroquinate synthase [Balneolales bacterium]